MPLLWYMNGDIKAPWKQLESTAQRNGVNKNDNSIIGVTGSYLSLEQHTKRKMGTITKTEDEAELQDEEDTEVDDKSLPMG